MGETPGQVRGCDGMSDLSATQLHPDVIFFDYGNTLASDSTERYSDIARYLVQHGLSLDHESFERGWAAAERYAAEYRRNNGRRTWLKDRVWFTFCRTFLEHAFDETAGGLAEEMHAVQFFTNQLYPDTLSTLRELRLRGYRLGVISNWEAPTLHSQFDRFGMTGYFELILPSREAEASKPDPHIFRAALGAMNVGPDRAIHVGDSYDCDVIGARGVGITPVSLNREGSAAPDGEPVLQILALSDILDVVA